MADEIKKEAENEIHRLVANGLQIFGKAEHWTADEIKKFAEWLKDRI